MRTTGFIFYKDLIRKVSRLNRVWDKKLTQLVLQLICLFALSTVILCEGEAKAFEPIKIVSPADGSIVSSPIEVDAQIFSGEDGLIRISLIDKHNNLLVRHVIRLESAYGDIVNFRIDLPFEIPNDHEEAIIVIAAWDKFQRPIFERTAGINLVTSGLNSVIEPEIVEPWLQIDSPKANEKIKTAFLLVTGTVIPTNNAPVFFSLVNEHKGEIVTKQLAVDVPGEPKDFQIELPFSSRTLIKDMRLIIRQPGVIHGTNAILDSVPLFFLPAP